MRLALDSRRQTLFPYTPTGAFFPEIVSLKFLGCDFSMRQKPGVVTEKSCHPKWQMSHAETVCIVNSPQRERGRINRTRGC